MTIRGESFASRVAASLLYSAGLEYLICDSLKELEDMSVYLANHREILSRIRFELEKLVGYDSNTLSQTNESDRACERTFGRTFDTNCFRFHWEHSLHLVWELKAMERNVDESSKFHVVVWNAVVVFCIVETGKFNLFIKKIDTWISMLDPSSSFFEF